MTIVQELKKLIASRGGDPTGVMTISQALKVLNALEAEEAAEEETPDQGTT